MNKLNSVVVHPVKLYWNKVECGWQPSGNTVKYPLLKTGLKSLIEIGRVPLTAKYEERYSPYDNSYLCMFGFETIYIGRKSIYRKGIRHNLRKAGRDFAERNRDRISFIKEAGSGWRSI